MEVSDKWYDAMTSRLFKWQATCLLLGAGFVLMFSVSYTLRGDLDAALSKLNVAQLYIADLKRPVDMDKVEMAHFELERMRQLQQIQLGEGLMEEQRNRLEGYMSSYTERFTPEVRKEARTWKR